MEGERERATKAFRELSKSLRSLPGNPAPKEVHKLRTAARRVEAIVSALPGDGKKARRLLKTIAAVRKAAGGVRDMDVLSANARKTARYAAGDSLTRLLEVLQAARQQNAGEFTRTLGRRRKAARENLKDYAKLVKAALNGVPANGKIGKGQPGQPDAQLHAMAMRAVRDLGEWPPLDAGNIHEFRLKVKELRYILQLHAEPESELANALWRVQRRIGDWHDWHQLGEIAREVLHSEGDQPLLAHIEHTAQRKFDQALKTANALRGKYLSAPLALGI